MYDIRFQRAVIILVYYIPILQLGGVVTMPHTTRPLFLSVKSLQDDNKGKTRIRSNLAGIHSNFQ